MRRRAKEQCRGCCPQMTEVMRNPQDHRLAAADVDGVTMLFCTSCGGWATSKPGKLARPCVRRTKWGAECLRLIALGWTPVAEHSRRPIHGLWLVADLRKPLLLEAPEAQDGEVPLTAEEQEEAEYQTWSHEWASAEHSRLQDYANVLAAAALEPIGTGSAPVPLS